MMYSVAAALLVAYLLVRKYQSALPHGAQIIGIAFAGVVGLVVIGVLSATGHFLMYGPFPASKPTVDATYLLVFVVAIPVMVETARFSSALVARRLGSDEFTSGILGASYAFSILEPLSRSGIGSSVDPFFQFDLLPAAATFLFCLSIVLFHYDMFLLIRKTYSTRKRLRVGATYVMAVCAHCGYQLLLALPLMSELMVPEVIEPAVITAANERHAGPVPATYSWRQVVYWGAAVAVLLLAKLILERAAAQDAGMSRMPDEVGAR